MVRPLRLRSGSNPEPVEWIRLRSPPALSEVEGLEEDSWFPSFPRVNLATVFLIIPEMCCSMAGFLATTTQCVIKGLPAERQLLAFGPMKYGGTKSVPTVKANASPTEDLRIRGMPGKCSIRSNVFLSDAWNLRSLSSMSQGDSPVLLTNK